MNALAADLIKLYKKHKPSYSEIIECNKIARKTLNITRPQTKPVHPKAIATPDIKKFMEVVSAASPKDKLMMNIFLYLGLRISEVSKIKISDINLAPGEERLFAHRKGGLDKEFIIPKLLADELRLYIDANKNNIYLFESRFHKAYTTRGISKKIKVYKDKAGISSNLTAHAFRRTLASYLATQGWNAQQLKLVTGHEDSKSLRHYVEANPEMIRNSLNTAANKLHLRT